MAQTIEQMIARGTERLRVTSGTPRLDAELLVMHVTQLGRTALITCAHTALTPEQQRLIDELLARRQAGEPIAYLTGTREFWSLTLRISPAVLIPRSETELLVEQALARIPESGACAIADLGTGSGAIAIAIAHERPQARVVASDCAQDALSLARENAQRHHCDNIEFRLGQPGTWFAPLASDVFDVIVSNPPYVANGDPHLLAGDVRFEPRGALQGGPDGLDAIRKIAFGAKARLRPGGWLLLEHGYDQAAAVTRILQRYGYTAIETYRDHAGHGRVTAGHA